MSDGNNLQSKYELDSHRAHLAARFILLGLAVEIIGVFIPPVCAWIPGAVTIASASLIWIGVWGELHFSAKAKEAGDGIVAEAKKEAAEASERAAKAELEIARLKTPRMLNDNAFVSSLAGKPSWPVVEILYVDASDCPFLAMQIAVALTKAGWESTTPKPMRGINPACMFPTAFIPETVSYGGNLTGVTVVATEVSLDEPHSLPALQRALIEGLSTKEAKGGRDPSMRPVTLRVVVAPRV